jgi:hypothetical protein
MEAPGAPPVRLGRARGCAKGLGPWAWGTPVPLPAGAAGPDQGCIRPPRRSKGDGRYHHAMEWKRPRQARAVVRGTTASVSPQANLEGPAELSNAAASASTGRGRDRRRRVMKMMLLHGSAWLAVARLTFGGERMCGHGRGGRGCEGGGGGTKGRGRASFALLQAHALPSTVRPLPRRRVHPAACPLMPAGSRREADQLQHPGCSSDPRRGLPLCATCASLPARGEPAGFLTLHPSPCPLRPVSRLQGSSSRVLPPLPRHRQPDSHNG